MHRARQVVAGVLVAGICLAGLAVADSPPASAAGVTTHAWMARDAVDLVDDPQLRALLEANLGQLEGGAQFPDSGYWNSQFGTEGGDYGEEAHWHRFFDAYATQIAEDESCGDLTDPVGPCAPRIAHLMGAMAHGMGDEVWDWLFEPQAPDRGESYLPPALATFFSTGGLEVQMDICAIDLYGRQTTPDTPPVPATGELAQVFADVGRPDITVSGIEAGKGGMSILRGGEALITPVFADDIAANMPWTSSNLTSAPGGVAFAAAAIAPEYEALWGRLLGEQPATEVSVTYPADGQVGVPATGWERSFQPGSAPGGGGAENRIAAALTYSLPYAPTATGGPDVPEQLPPGAMTLTEVATGDQVAAQPGYPRVVPYGADSGAHMIGFQPAEDLQPCTEYRVDVTSALVDAQGEPVEPRSWTFRTGGCCQDPPDSFTDVGVDHPFAADVAWMAEQCISTGYDDGSFRPSAAVTRQSMSAFLYRLAGSPIVDPPGSDPFDDVSTAHPFATEIAWLASTGVSTGFGDSTFRPAAPVTRQSMSAFLYRLAGEPSFVVPDAARFPDVGTGHPFFAEVEWLAAEGIAVGYGDGSFRPADPVTRQSMSAFMRRFADSPGVSPDLAAVPGWPGV